jgi:hypothetical protein
MRLYLPWAASAVAPVGVNWATGSGPSIGQGAVANADGPKRDREPVVGLRRDPYDLHASGDFPLRRRRAAASTPVKPAYIDLSLMAA